MRVVFCWMGVSGYMTACWRELAGRPGIDLRVMAHAGGTADTPPFADSLADGFRCTLLRSPGPETAGWIADQVASAKPDVVVVAGWSFRPYTRLPYDPRLSGARFILAMDTPWWGAPRQWLARTRLARYIGRMDRAVVSGERSWQYAWRLGVPQGHIRRGLYGIDGVGCKAAYDRRVERPGGWPRAFLFVGRLDPVKGIQTLLDGYRRYRTGTPDPWPLIVCGTGPLQAQVAAEPGVDLRGFVQPGDLPGIWSEAGAFVLASNYDPWPLALVEACAAGLPVIHTDACGSAVELVRPYYNGVTIGSGDAAALARGMQWMHQHHEKLPAFGRRAHELAAAYTAVAWADRWVEWLEELTAV